MRQEQNFAGVGVTPEYLEMIGDCLRFDGYAPEDICVEGVLFNEEDVPEKLQVSFKDPANHPPYDDLHSGRLWILFSAPARET